MPGTLLVCYDVETASENTDGFLAGATPMHRDLGIPATIFFTGKTIETRNAACLAAAQERFDDRTHGTTYVEYLNWALEYVARHNLVFSLNSHDHGTPTADAFHQTKGAWLRPALKRARALGLRFMGCEEYYQGFRTISPGICSK